MITDTAVSAAAHPFSHLAFLYRGVEEYLAGIVAFIRDGLAVGEPVAVAVPEPRLSLIDEELGHVGSQVRLVDMVHAGRNPGWIIPGVLRAFADSHPGVRVRIVGEPTWPGRSALEYPACAQNEALTNRALDGRPVTVLCPYDADGLDSDVLTDAAMTHPVVIDGGASRRSSSFAPDHVVAVYNEVLPEMPDAPVVAFGRHGVAHTRAFAVDHAAAFGMRAARLDDLALAVGELATNSILHGGGSGTLRIWAENGHVACEVRDSGHIVDPLAGRIPAHPSQIGGRGLLLVNSLADLVRIHTEPVGTAIRIHLRLPGG
ncbi:MAG: anti-sigma factor RsbA family regulatory protein [Jiangellaceae bacterium]